MKLQFSLATLLFWTAVVASVVSICVYFPVVELQFQHSGKPLEFHRRPTNQEILGRIELATIATGLALFALLAFRRLKSRRENGPPVG